MSEDIGEYDVSEISLWDLPNILDESQSNETPFQGISEKELSPIERKLVDLNKNGITLQDWNELVEAGRKEGYEKGYSEAYEKAREEGYDKGLEESQPIVEAKLNTIESMISELNNPMDNVNQAIEERLLNFSLKIASLIANKTIAEDEEMLKEIVSKAVSEIPPSKEKIVFKISPNDRGVLTDLASKNGWELVNDESIAQGGFVIESGMCKIDATVEERIKNVIDDFTSKIKPVPREIVEVIEAGAFAEMTADAPVSRPSRDRGDKSSRSSSGSSSRSSSRTSSSRSTRRK